MYLTKLSFANKILDFLLFFLKSLFNLQPQRREVFEDLLLKITLYSHMTNICNSLMIKNNIHPWIFFNKNPQRVYIGDFCFWLFLKSIFISERYEKSHNHCVYDQNKHRNSFSFGYCILLGFFFFQFSIPFGTSTYVESRWKTIYILLKSFLL